MPIDLAGRRWGGIENLWRRGAAVEDIAAAAKLTVRFIERIAERHGWTRAVEPPAGMDGFQARLAAAVSRRIGDLALDGGADEEALARSLTALAKSTDAAGRLARSLEGEADHARSDEDVRASLRRKLQGLAGRARPAAP